MSAPSILLFDGWCSLCNASVDFVLKRDPKQQLCVGAMQQPEGQRLLRQVGLPADYLATLVLVENDGIYLGSTAALRVAKKLRGAWPLLYPLIVVPTWIRDPIYHWISRHRYRWFGKETTCKVPTHAEKGRFLTENHPIFSRIG
jgi:predicted DCC family thiol-disulfide oxidoreductase YuxK